MADSDVLEGWTEERLSAMCVISGCAGEAVGFENAAATALKRAQDAFGRGKDEEARLMRSLATELSLLSSDKRKQQAEYQRQYDSEFDD